jgi:hypothetical protein
MQFVRRSWGWYFVILSRKNFKIKLLKFKRGGALSVQRHNFRKELWLFLKEGSFREIQVGEVHTYYCVTPAYILEIQYGERCEESDIERL